MRLLTLTCAVLCCAMLAYGQGSIGAMDLNGDPYIVTETDPIHTNFLATTWGSHTGSVSAHHVRYTDAEATNAATVAGFVKADVTNGVSSLIGALYQGSEAQLATYQPLTNVYVRMLAATTTVTTAGTFDLRFSGTHFGGAGGVPQPMHYKVVRNGATVSDLTNGFALAYEWPVCDVVCTSLSAGVYTNEVWVKDNAEGAGQANGRWKKPCLTDRFIHP